MKQKASRELLHDTTGSQLQVGLGVIDIRLHGDQKICCKKVFLSVLLCMIFMVFFDLHLIGQPLGIIFDTIRFERVGKANYDYSVSNSTTKAISYNQSHLEKCKGDRFTIGGEVGRELLTAITGIGTGASKDVYWLLSGKITTDDQQRNWDVDIYCPGSIHKSKERVRNDDGSFSTENIKEMEVYWDKSVGYIINRSDTIGYFSVVNEPRDVPELYKWTKDIYSQKLEGLKGRVMDRREFALWGDLYGQEIMIIYNADNKLIYLFKETELSGIFQPEHRKLLVRKKKIKKPFLLVNNALHDEIKSDVLLMSMVGQWFLVSSNEPE